MKTLTYIVALVVVVSIGYVSVVSATETGSINPEYLDGLALESMSAIAPVIVQLHGGSVEYVWGQHSLCILVRYGKCVAEVSVDHLVCNESSHCFKVLTKWMKGVSKKDFFKAFIKSCAEAEKERDQERKGK